MRGIFDIRYHWLTLAAIFAALGLGVLMGVGLVQGGYVAQEQDRLLAQLETQLVSLRDENRRLHRQEQIRAQELAALQRSVELLAAAAARGRLQGREYVVVHDGSPGSRRWQTVLSAAGARVTEMGYEHWDPVSRQEPAAGWILINPPENVALEGLEAAAIVWDNPHETAARREEKRGTPGGLELEASQGALAAWLLVEALHQGWKGHWDARSPSSLPDTLEKWVEGLFP